MKPPIPHFFPRLGVWCLGAVALLAGCAVPIQVKQDPSVSADWHQRGYRPEVASVIAIPGLRTWWRTWNDLQLNALVEEALDQNLDLAQSQLRLSQQRVLAHTAYATYLPNISAESRTLQEVAAIDSYVHARIHMSWDLGLFGNSQSLQRAADASVLHARAQLQVSRVALAAQVVRCYLEIQLAQYQRTLYERIATLDAEALRLLLVRQAQRIGSKRAVERQRLRINATASQLAKVIESQARAAHDLAVLLGQTQPKPEWLQAYTVMRMPQPTAPTLIALSADMIRARPDLQSAEASVELAAAQVGIAQAALYPRLMLSGSLPYSYNITQRRKVTSYLLPILGAQIDIPMLDWGRRRTLLDVNGLVLESSIRAYQQSVVHGISNVDASLVAVQTQGLRLEGLAKSQEVLKQQARIQSVRQRHGLNSTLDTIQAERAVLQSRSDIGAARAALLLAYVALYKALCGAPPDSLQRKSTADTRHTDISGEIYP